MQTGDPRPTRLDQADAATDAHRALHESLECVHRDVLGCLSRLSGSIDVDDDLAELAAARVVVRYLPAAELESVLLRSVVTLEDRMREALGRAVLALAALERLAP